VDSPRCEKRFWLPLANSLKEPSDQNTVEPVSARLHLGDDGANDTDLPQPFGFGEDTQRPDHVDSSLNGDASGTNFVDQQLRASLLGKGDRFALSFVQNSRQTVYD